MENYKGIYFNNSKRPNLYESGAHFNYKDLYDKLLEIYNKRNNIKYQKKKLNLNISPSKRDYDNKNIDEKNNLIKKVNSSSKRKNRTRNKKMNSNYSNSNSLDNNHYKEINLNILEKTTHNKNSEQEYNKNSTWKNCYYNKNTQIIHNNSINKNYKFIKRKVSKKNLSAENKDKQKIISIKYNPINIYINKNKNNSNNNSIYNYGYINFENGYFGKMKKKKTNPKNIWNIGIYKYNLYNNIFLKNKINNKLKQYKYNSFINNSIDNKDSCINKNSVSSTKNKENSKIKNLSNKENLNEISHIKNKRIQCHIKTINYASIYSGLNNNKTPNYNLRKSIINDKSKEKYKDAVYNMKSFLNKVNNKKNIDFLYQINKDKNSYAKIKKNQLSLSKRLHYKDLFVKERIKRDSQSTEYE